jgi:hypothetical protein
MRATLRTVLSASLLVLAWSMAGQQQFPSLQKGLQPEKLYQFNDIDHVNVFNGNVTINIPVGLEYPLNGGLSYRLNLSYNSKAWDLVEVAGGKVHAHPSRRSNAGMGWTLGMGRFVPHNDPTNSSNGDTYEAPDGGDHLFFGDYTLEGAHLRQRAVDATTREIDFPDGITRQFKLVNNEWELRQIRRAGSSSAVTITHTPAPVIPQDCNAGIGSSSITDSFGRLHTLVFRNRCVDGQARPMVESVSLQGPEGSTALYTFTYALGQVLQKPAGDNDFDTQNWQQTHTAPLLTSMQLPDGSSYEFTYYAPNLTGEIKTVVLPTRGKIRYTYADVLIPSLDLCANTYATVSATASRETAAVS